MPAKLQNDGERAELGRLHNGEVTTVQGEHVAVAQAFSKCNETRVRATETQIRILLDQLCRPLQIVGGGTSMVYLEDRRERRNAASAAARPERSIMNVASAITIAGT
jgi:hypothetical protein